MRPLLLLVILSTLSTLLVVSLNTKISASEIAGQKQDIEVGVVEWNRNFEATLKQSAKTGKPVFALFQEVPGCSGCKSFGKEVLSNELLVEAIESEFHPVLIYNNRGGKDAELLKQYGEPSWNYQVIRFLDGKGEDIIPRRDRIWTTDSVAIRMINTLQKANRKVPNYLLSLAYQGDSYDLKEAAFAMFCFWTGEKELGAVPGVVKTEAGFLEGREVTRVWYDGNRLETSSLIRHARQVKCADKAYLPQADLKKENTGTLQSAVFVPGGYSKAKASDQKRQIGGSKFLKIGLNDYQLTKVNAFARSQPNKALSYLSPRQRALLNKGS